MYDGRVTLEVQKGERLRHVEEDREALGPVENGGVVKEEGLERSIGHVLESQEKGSRRGGRERVTD